MPSMFLRQQLEYLSNRVVEESFPEMLMANGTLVPITSEVPEGAQTVAYTLFTKLGEAAILANGSQDIPTVSGFVEKRYAEIYTIADQYTFTATDLAHAQYANTNLDARLALAAREAIERKIDSIGYVGDAQTRLLGLLNQPNVPVFVLPADGNSNGGVNSTEFRHKTAEQIYRDMVNFVSAIRQDTRGAEVADTLIMPIEQFEIINALPYPTNSVSGKTVMQFFLDTQRASGGIQNIICADYLAGQGVGNTDMMVAYKNSSSKISYEIPMELKQMPQEYRAMQYYNPLTARVAGVLTYKPLSCRYLYGC